MKIVGKVAKILGLLVIGGFVGAMLVSVRWYGVISSYSSAMVLEIASDARQLQRGDAEGLLERKARALPALVQQIESQHRKYLSEAEYNGTLWQVQAFYEDCGTDPPEEIRPILDALPPRPPTCCELRKLEEEAAAEETEAAEEGQGAEE